MRDVHKAKQHLREVKEEVLLKQIHVDELSRKDDELQTRSGRI